MDFVYTAVLFVILLLSAAAGWAVRRKLPDSRFSREAVDSIRLLMGMLLTFSALVLGLLTSNAKQRFDGYETALSAFGSNLITLDHRLRLYGPAADPIRQALRAYTAASIADSWPDEPLPSGQYPKFADSEADSEADSAVESREAGTLLNRIEADIETLAPPDDLHRQIAASLRDRIAQLLQQRWLLIFSTRSIISWPFLTVLTSWLAIIFAIVGLTSPHNRLLYVVITLAALSIASPLYLILDYSDALTGLIQLSSFPMRVALSHMDQAK